LPSRRNRVFKKKPGFSEGMFFTTQVEYVSFGGEGLPKHNDFPVFVEPQPKTSTPEGVIFDLHFIP